MSDAHKILISKASHKITGCSCGWRVDPKAPGDADDQLAMHVAAWVVLDAAPRSTFELARRDREHQIAVLKACICGWPIERQRNGSGHSPNCPAHGIWFDQQQRKRAGG